MRLGLPPLRTHGVRHTFATLALANGESPKLVAQVLGHSVRQLLETYAHVMPGDDRAMTERFAAMLERPAVAPRYHEETTSEQTPW